MPVIMEESPVRDSMITIKRFLLVLTLLIFFTNCEETVGDIPIPFIDFQDIEINLDLPAYKDLNIDGRSIYINTGGVRGIILYRESATSYVAFERNCSYDPNGASSTVEIHSSGFHMTDPSCGSIFQFPAGMPSSGLARSPLRIYKSTLSGRNLTITDESENGY